MTPSHPSYRIVPYDAAWPEVFEAERALIAAALTLPSEHIEHIGSTAVPGLAAKPIIDMMPGLRSLDDAPALIPKLESVGYSYVPEFERPTAVDEGMPFRRYFRKDREGVRAFHMHMVEHGSEFWVKHLLFRDYLRAHGEARDAYAALKRELAADYNSRLLPESNVNIGYTDRKTAFVEATLEHARAWRGMERGG